MSVPTFVADIISWTSNFCEAFFWYILSLVIIYIFQRLLFVTKIHLIIWYQLFIYVIVKFGTFPLHICITL